MSTVNLDPISDGSSQDWYYDQCSDAWIGIAGDDYYPDDTDASDYSNGYIYAYYDGQTSTFNIAAPTGAVTSVTNLRVYCWGYNNTDSDPSSSGSDLIDVNVYIDGAWQGAQMLAAVEGDWTYLDFSGSWSSLTGLQLEFQYVDPNDFEDGCQIYRAYIEATYTAGPATSVLLSGPTSGPVGGPSSNFTVSLDGTNSGVTVTPSSTSGSFSPTSVSLSTSTISATFTYTASTSGTTTISVTNSGSLTNPSSISYTASYIITVPNYSFETPSVGYQYNPTGGSWTFLNGAGLTSGSGFGFSNTPPDGVQAAFLQNSPSEVNQTFTLTVGAAYTVIVSMAPRSGNNPGNPIEVFWDSTQIGSTATPSGTSWVDYSFGPYTAVSTSQSLRFVGTNTSGDITSYIDNVRITFTPASPATALSLTGPSSGGNGVPSTNFTVTANGSLSSTVTVTLSDSGATGSFSPSSLTLSGAALSATFTYTPSSSGVKTISITNNGSLTNPSSLSYTSIAVSGTVTYISTDTSTEGSWIGVYGFDGYIICNGSSPDTTSLPSYVTSYDIVGDSVTSWTGSTSDTRAIQKPSPATDRTASTWYSSGYFTITMSLGSSLRDVSLYFLDWDNTTRTETWTANDTSANVLLASGSVASYHNGKWIKLQCSGTFVITITNTTSGENAVLSAIMFDELPGPATYLSLTGPTVGALNTASSNFTVTMLPNGSVGTSSTTVTPNTDQAGTFSPTTVTLTDASRTATFTFTPTTTAYNRITLTNNNSLTNPTTLGYSVSGAQAAGGGSVILKPYFTGPLYYLIRGQDQPSPKLVNLYTGGLFYPKYTPANSSKGDMTGPVSVSMAGGVITTPTVFNQFFLVYP